MLVVGAGDQAAESVIALSENNRVTMAVRGPELSRPRTRNISILKSKQVRGEIVILYDTTVTSINENSVTLKTPDGLREIPNDRTIINAGSRAPYDFLGKVGVKIADTWNSRRYIFFAIFIAFIISMYLFKSFGMKALLGHYGLKSAAEISNPVLSFLAAKWYGVLYTLLVGGFGLWILNGKRKRHYRLHDYIRWKTISCIFFQTVFLFGLTLMPVKYLGAKAATLITVWPLTLAPASWANSFFVMGNSNPELVFYTFFTVFLAFIAMPVFVYFHGKRCCSWICGCGALAETFGEPFRRLAPKGYISRRRERIIYVVLTASVLMTGMIVLKNTAVSAPAVNSVQYWYNIIVYLIFSGIIGVGMYPFFGARIWCRYLCPLAAYMNLLGAVLSKYKISSNDRCIDCGQCNRYCEMGIDIKGFALRQESFSVKNTPCIACGECIALCPMDVLTFGDRPG